MTTICSFCGKNISKNEENNSNFVVCKNCNKFTAKGANSKNIKLGKKDDTKKR